jgi:hypothetical protein
MLQFQRRLNTIQIFTVESEVTTSLLTSLTAKLVLRPTKETSIVSKNKLCKILKTQLNSSRSNRKQNRNNNHTGP